MTATDIPQGTEEKYCWVVMFQRGEKLYTYVNRTVPFMSATLAKYHAKNGTYPYRMWVIVDDEVQKVAVT